MSDLPAKVSSRDAACTSEPCSESRAASQAESDHRGRTLRRVAIAGSLGAGAWLAMMAVGQTHASAAAAPHVAGVLGATANVVHAVKPLAHTDTPRAQAISPKPAAVRAPLAHIVVKTTHTAVATSRPGRSKTVAAKTAPVVHSVVVRVVTPTRTVVQHATAHSTALPMVKPVVKQVDKTVGAVTATVRRVTAPVLVPVTKVISPILTPIVAPIVGTVIAPIVTVVDPITTPITGRPVPVRVPATPVVGTSTPVTADAHAVVGTGARKASERTGTSLGATSTTVSSAAPARVHSASVSPDRHVFRAASVTNIGVRSSAANGGGRPFGPAPVPAPVSGATSAAGAHRHDGGPSLAGRNARLAPPVSVSAARLGSDRLPGAPICFTDVSPD